MSVSTWADLVDDAPTMGDWVEAGTWLVLLSPYGDGVLSVASVESSSGGKGSSGRATISGQPVVAVTYTVTTWADLVAERPTTGDWVEAGTWGLLLFPHASGATSATDAESSSGRKNGKGHAALQVGQPAHSGYGSKGGRGHSTVSVEPLVDAVYTPAKAGSVGITSRIIETLVGTRTSQGEGLLYVTDASTGVGHKQQWYFTPPTRKVYGDGNRFWRRVYIEQGISVLIVGEAIIAKEALSAEDFENADRVYSGGRTYPIGDEERLALQAAGYEPYPEDE